MMNFILAICAFIILSAFESQPIDKQTGQALINRSQPASERSAQESLSKSSDSMWKILTSTKIDYNEKTGKFNATYPNNVKALNGSEITVNGFVLPLEAKEKFQHFILSSRTPTCPFCPPGAPNEIIDVYSIKPLEWKEAVVSVSGKFAITDNQNLGLIYKITDAKTDSSKYQQFRSIMIYWLIFVVIIFIILNAFRLFSKNKKPFN